MCDIRISFTGILDKEDNKSDCDSITFDTDACQEKTVYDKIL